MKNTKKNKKMFLEQLAKSAIIQIACEKTGIGKSTIYRWREEDQEFDKAVEDAVREGTSLVTDLAESQLIGAIKDRSVPAITLWLRTYHPKYKPALEITGEINHSREELNDDEVKVLVEALRLAGYEPHELIKYNNHANTGDNSNK